MALFIELFATRPLEFRASELCVERAIRASTCLDELLVKEGSRYKGPYLILNAALSPAKGSELAWQERLAGNLMFSPLFCGFEFPSLESKASRGAYGGTGDFR